MAQQAQQQQELQQVWLGRLLGVVVQWLGDYCCSCWPLLLQQRQGPLQCRQHGCNPLVSLLDSHD